MAQTIHTEVAKAALLACGYQIRSLRPINEGSNHFVFDITLGDGRPAICKFAKIRETEQDRGPAHKDTLFGGTLSLEREAYLFRMIREKAAVPTPEVYGVHDSAHGTFILLEKMSGIPQKECMVRSGFSRQIFLDSMEYLGRDFARIQQVSFPTFGNIMAESVIEPAGMDNFSDRFLPVVDMRLARCRQKQVFTAEEDRQTAAFFHKRLQELRPHFDAQRTPPVLVFTDMHAENFFTDEKGKPTGYFDLESAQAAPAALEFYGFRFFLFNYYDQASFRDAEASFWRGYQDAGGAYAPQNGADEEAIAFLAGCRLLELAESYWGVRDGIRDTWGPTMKELLFTYMQSGQIDYDAVGTIWRQRDGQPLTPQKA